MKTLPSAGSSLPSTTVRSRSQTVFTTILRAVAALILLQTLFFKFTGAEESRYIFTKVGMEPVGRIGSGVAELIAVILLLFPTTVALGAALSIGVMAGALFFHLTVLGIEVQGDGGLLFGLAVTVFVAAAVLLFLYRKQLPVIGRRFP